MVTNNARKIIHIDQDAFFSSVEQRDNPGLKGRAVVVAGTGPRSVVAAASYEARAFGIRSAMPLLAAKAKCSELTVVPPRFDAYREISRLIRTIFARYTPLIEPLSLDEAYLDVTDWLQNHGSATEIAQEIRAAIFAETGLTASAGVSYNKFLAKLGSGYRKPNGLTVIRPGEGAHIVADLDVSRFHGIGPATAARMNALGIKTGRDLRSWPVERLIEHFGKAGSYYHLISWGEDDRPVRPDRERKSYSAENTFDQDTADRDAILRELSTIIDKVWEHRDRIGKDGRTVTLKAKYANFEQVTRSKSFASPLAERTLLNRAAEELLDTLMPLSRPLRLVGISISNLAEPAKEPAAVQQMELTF